MGRSLSTICLSVCRLEITSTDVQQFWKWTKRNKKIEFYDSKDDGYDDAVVTQSWRL